MSPKRLGKSARRLLEQVDEGKAVALIPAIVPVELSLLRESRRGLVGPLEVQSLIQSNPCFQIQPLDLAHAIDFTLLASLRDPFDRLIVAAARVCGASLISDDERIVESGLVDIIWD
jgi:PIN domain nuclease of toxin-antitoxin system